MNKFLFFFILIFSVFFSYQTAQATYSLNMSGVSVSNDADGYITIADYPALSGNTQSSPYQFIFTSGCYGTYICVGEQNVYRGIYPDTTTRLVHRTVGGWNLLFNMFDGGIYNKADGGYLAGTGDPGDGNYWAEFLNYPYTGDNAWFAFSQTGGIWSGGSIPPDITQGIFDYTPANGAVVSTSGTGNVPISFKYYLSSVYSPAGVDEVCMRGLRTDAPGDFEYCTTAVYDSETTVSTTINALAIDSQWEWRVYFTRPGFFIDEFEITIRGTQTFFISRFTIDISATAIYDAYVNCSITDIAGCLQNAIVYLFYPSPGALSSFNSLYNTFKYKPPFGYISAVQTALQGINDTGTSAFTLTTMPILNTYIFTPVRTALIWVLWLAFVFIFYRRLSNIHL